MLEMRYRDGESGGDIEMRAGAHREQRGHGMEGGGRGITKTKRGDLPSRISSITIFMHYI
jgi:hypothetical protein